MKKSFAASLLALVLFSCEKRTIIINLDEFNGSHEKAFASQFRIKDDRVYQNNAKSFFDVFSGKLSLIELDKSIKEITIDEGEIEKLVIRDHTNKVVAEGERDGNNFRVNLKVKGFGLAASESEFKLTNFSNKAFIIKPLSEQEGSSITKGEKGDEVRANVRINRYKNLIITEAVIKRHQVQTLKTMSFIRYLSDFTRVEVAFIEYADVDENHDINNIVYDGVYDLYTELVSIKNNKDNMTLKTSWSYDGELRVVSEQEDYKGKNCSVSEVLVSEISPLALDESECVSDGLKFMNEVLKKQISREALKNRFIEKQVHNRFLNQQKSDVDFYF